MIILGLLVKVFKTYCSSLKRLEYITGFFTILKALSQSGLKALLG